MKHLILAALTAATIASSGLAQDDLTGPPLDQEQDEWADLDRELGALETLRVEEAIPGPYIWGYTRINYAFSNELRVPPNNARLSGFNLDNIRINASGVSSGIEYRVTAEARAGSLFLEDAWARVPLGEEVSTTLGRFRTPFLRSATIEARDLLFISRTRNGIFYSVRDQGVMFNGDHGRLHWAAAAHNGSDGNSQEWLTTANVKVNLAGQDELPWEGAYLAGPGTRLSTGISVSDDGALADGTAWALDLYLVHRGVSLQAEWLSYGDGYDNVFVGEQRGGTQPWSVTASYMIVKKKYELALRFDDFDDKRAPLDYKRQTFTVGVNRYIQGHDLKWQLNYASARKSGVDDGTAVNLFALGLTLSF